MCVCVCARARARMRTRNQAFAVESFRKAGPAHAASLHSLAWHQVCVSYEEEDTCVSYEEEDTCLISCLFSNARLVL